MPVPRLDPDQMTPQQRRDHAWSPSFSQCFLMLGLTLVLACSVVSFL